MKLNQLQTMHLREIDVNLIVVFDALLVENSVTLAAQRLGRTPSAISHALAKLREIFNDDLFVRAGQQLVPTTRAEQLAPTVHVLISGIESLLRPTVPFVPADQERTFTIIASEVYELTCRDKFASDLDDMAPGINITWKTFRGPDSYDELRNGEAQFLITGAHNDESNPDFSWQTLFDDCYVIAARKAHSFEKKFTHKDFKSSGHIFVDGPDSISKSYLNYLFERGVLEENLRKVSSLITGLFMVMESDYLIGLPKHTLKKIQKHLQISNLSKLDPPFKSLSRLGWHRRYERDACHAWLREKFLQNWKPENRTSSTLGRR